MEDADKVKFDLIRSGLESQVSLAVANNELSEYRARRIRRWLRNDEFVEHLHAKQDNLAGQIDWANLNWTELLKFIQSIIALFG